MKLAMYIIIGIGIFTIVNFLSTLIGGFIGTGPYEVGLIVNAISILCSIVVICTIVIVNTIKQT